MENIPPLPSLRGEATLPSRPNSARSGGMANPHPPTSSRAHTHNTKSSVSSSTTQPQLHASANTAAGARDVSSSSAAQQRAQVAPPDLLGAKAALSALQHGVVGERHSTGMALEKQMAVGSDVRSFAIVGSDVWMAHSDGNMTIRDCRTGHLLDPQPMPYLYQMLNPGSFSGRGAGAGGGGMMSSTATASGGSGSDHHNATSTSGSHQQIGLVGQSPMPWCLLAVTPIAPRAVAGSAISVSGSTIWAGFADGNMEVFDAESRKSVGVVQKHHSGGVYCLASFSNTVFSGSNDFQIGMWDAVSRAYLRQFSGHNNYVRCLHAEGALLFSGSDDATVRVWNVTSGGGEISRATFHRKSGVSVMTRVGPNMWSGDNSGDIIVWRIQTMREERLLKEHTGRVTALKKVGRSRVYSAGADRLICVWDAFQHALLHRVAEHNSWVLALCFPCSLTRHYVWTSAADSTLRCFHHDEFVPMTSTLENCLEGAWYGSDYAPYRDLAEAQSEQIQQLLKKLSLLQDSETQARERATHLEMHLQHARDEITDIDIKNHRELESVSVMKAHFADFERRELDLRRQVREAQMVKDQTLQEIQAIREENERIKQDCERAVFYRQEAQKQSEHMESLLVLAVQAQEEAMAAKAGGSAAAFAAAGRATGATAGGKLASPRGGTGTGATSPRGSPRGGGMLGPKQRPLILVTMGAEQAKVVADLEAEIADLHEKLQRLQRVKAAQRPGSSGRGGRPGSSKAQQLQQQTAQQDETGGTRDWASQAQDIINARRAEAEAKARANAAAMYGSDP